MLHHLIERKGSEMRRFLLVLTVASLAGLWFNNASAEDWSPLWSTANCRRLRWLRPPRRTAWSSLPVDALPAVPQAMSWTSTTRPRVPFTATLSQGRWGPAATSAGSLVFFAGGDNGISSSNVVDIYNTSTGIWSTATLSQPRYEPSATSAGNQVFLAGGLTGNANVESSVVNINNTTSGTWSTANLSQAAHVLAAASAGGKVVFGGGSSISEDSGASNVVDIYDTSAGTWSSAALSAGTLLFCGHLGRQRHSLRRWVHRRWLLRPKQRGGYLQHIRG